MCKYFKSALFTPSVRMIYTFFFTKFKVLRCYESYIFLRNDLPMSNFYFQVNFNWLFPWMRNYFTCSFIKLFIYVKFVLLRLLRYFTIHFPFWFISVTFIYIIIRLVRDACVLYNRRTRFYPMLRVKLQRWHNEVFFCFLFRSKIVHGSTFQRPILAD